jgi:hypothetical protein
MGLSGKRFLSVRVHSHALNRLQGSGNGFLPRDGPAHVTV